MLKADEVTQALEKEIAKYQSKLEVESVGYVLQVGDGIARVYGLDAVMAGELVTFEDGTAGLVLNREAQHCESVGRCTNNCKAARMGVGAFRFQIWRFTRVKVSQEHTLAKCEM